MPTEDDDVPTDVVDVTRGVSTEVVEEEKDKQLFG